jgi:hypothetical protein
MQILVKTFQGKIIRIDVENDDYIEDAKNKISAEEGCPVSSQRLMYNNIELKDTKNFGFYELEDGAFLNLIVKLQKETLNKSEESDNRVNNSSCASCAIF